MRRSWQQGEHYVWATGAAVALTLLMVATLVGVVLVNGLGFYWPADLAQARLRDGTRVLGEITGHEARGGPGHDTLQFKVGNRDLYGQDFRWIPGEQIAALEYPPEAVLLERSETERKRQSETERKRRRAREMVARGATVEEIARAFLITHRTVHRWLEPLGETVRAGG